MANVSNRCGKLGTALSVLLADNGHHVTIWSIDEKEVEMLDKKREHLTKLPGVKLSDGMTITGDLESAVKGKDFLVSSVAVYKGNCEEDVSLRQERSDYR